VSAPKFDERTRAVERALRTCGTSDDVIHAAAVELLRARGASGRLADVGCGRGRFRERMHGIAAEYIGVDLLRHPGLPPDVMFLAADLDRDPIPLPTESVDIVSALETIEHLENPRAFVRELVRVLRPGGLLVVTTPNQLSALSVLSLVARGHFSAFHGSSYPAHRTALVPIDLLRIAGECGLEDVELEFTCRGRIPLTPIHYPRVLSALFPRALSDNVLLVGRKSG
jgi:2-polyprenyl-3-methyl-5-hydroxy-6-metoxy-1,4-benzoquinol methylase